MASGKKHENATIFWSIPFGLTLTLLLGIRNGSIGALAFLFGGLWLSPDLDTHSQALKRWGIFQMLWWPYRKLIPHRSFFSHGPIIGTTIRIGYLIACAWFLLLILKTIDLTSVKIIINTIQNKITISPRTALSILLGIEASVWLHLLLDGDPVPTEWKRSKNK